MTWSFESKLGHGVRLFVGSVGGYLFISGLMALMGASLPLLGIARSEAILIAILTGFVTLIGLVIWIAATRRFLWLSAFIFTSAGVMMLLAPKLVNG